MKRLRPIIFVVLVVAGVIILRKGDAVTDNLARLSPLIKYNNELSYDDSNIILDQDDKFLQYHGQLQILCKNFLDYYSDWSEDGFHNYKTKIEEAYRQLQNAEPQSIYLDLYNSALKDYSEFAERINYKEKDAQYSTLCDLLEKQTTGFSQGMVDIIEANSDYKLDLCQYSGHQKCDFYAAPWAA